MTLSLCQSEEVSLHLVNGVPRSAIEVLFQHSRTFVLNHQAVEKGINASCIYGVFRVEGGINPDFCAEVLEESVDFGT